MDQSELRNSPCSMFSSAMATGGGLGAASHELRQRHRDVAESLQPLDDERQRLRRLQTAAVAVVQQDDGTGIGVREDVIDDRVHAGVRPVLWIDAPGYGRETQ